MNTLPLTQRPAWKKLLAHYDAIKDLHLRELFANDPDRGRRLCAQAVGPYFDQILSPPVSWPIPEHFTHLRRGPANRARIARLLPGVLTLGLAMI